MTLELTDIASGSGSMDLSDSYFDFPATDWYTDSLISQYFNLDSVASDDETLFRGVLGWYLPPPPPTGRSHPAFTPETPPDTSSFQPVINNDLPSLPAADIPGPSRFQSQTAEIQPDNDVRNRDGHYKGTTGGGPWVTRGLTHAPPIVPTTLPPAPPPPFVATIPLNWIEVPQRKYGHGHKLRKFQPLEPVSFIVGDRQGINMGDALRKMYVGLNGRDDPVLQDTAGAISCRLLFPGYPGNGGSCQIHTQDWTGERQPIKRSKLAHEVAKKLEKYLRQTAKLTLDKSVEIQWTIGQGFMHIDNMFLVRLVSVSKGSFQPEIWVADPSAPHVQLV